jgi:hypothetical protein
MTIENPPLSVQVGRWINTGWECFLQAVGTNLLIGLVAAALTGTLVILGGPVSAGLALAGIRKCEHGEARLQDFFSGFGNHFIPALLSSLLIGLFSLIGFIFLIVPGLVILAMYMFTFHYIVHRGQDFWEAMESSRKLVSRDYFGFVLFAVVLLAINFVGLVLVVGLLISLPVTAFAVTAAYFDCVGPVNVRPEGPVKIQ